MDVVAVAFTPRWKDGVSTNPANHPVKIVLPVQNPPMQPWQSESHDHEKEGSYAASLLAR